jgi:hypothetical protein
MNLTGEEKFEVHPTDGNSYPVILKHCGVNEILLIANAAKSHALKMALFAYQFRKRQRESARKNTPGAWPDDSGCDDAA